MKPHHKPVARANARAVLLAANCSVTQDFHTLTNAQVDVILCEADRVRYQKPKKANGSRGRYFFARLQREANFPKE